MTRQLEVRHDADACRVVTASISARLLLARQLEALQDMRWALVSGDDVDDPPAGVRACTVPMRRELAWSDARSFLRLLRLFRTRRFRFVQTHTPKASMLALPAARLSGTPAVYTIHGAMYFRGHGFLPNLLGWTFERWCCSWANDVLVQSREDLVALPQARICPAAKISYVGNGIDLARFTHVAPPVPGRARPTVLMVSRLVAEKGCRDFLSVAEQLHERADFVHVGPREADQRDRLTDAEVLRASRWVRFVGEVSDVGPYLAAADVVLLPSYREGIPRAAMEAAATGRPVVGYDVRGVREVIPPESGLLCAPGDVDALVSIVARLLSSEHHRRAQGRACREWVVQRFSEDAVMERLREFYSERGWAA
jgi:glycosyltransferase involved in cell wall biosynthesis